MAKNLTWCPGGDIPVRVRFFTGFGDGGFITSLMEALGRRGFDATLCSLATEGSYRAGSWLGGLGSLAKRMWVEPARMRRMVRTPGRALNVVATNPFYAPWLALGAEASHTVAWMLDLYPQALEAARFPLGPVWRAPLRNVAATTVRRSSATVYMGERLAVRAERRFGPSRLRAVIPFGADDRIFEPQIRPATKPLQFLYCGNMGRLHDLDTLAAALRVVLGDPGGCSARFTFACSGAGLAQFRGMVGNLPRFEALQIRGPLDRAGWIEALRSAHVGLVTMRPGAEEAILPSKMFSAMAAGQAILAITPPDSDVARLLARHKAGWNFAPGDVAGVVELTRSLAANPGLLEDCRRRALEAARRCYSASALAEDWERLFERIWAMEDGLEGGRKPR